MLGHRDPPVGLTPVATGASHSHSSAAAGVAEKEAKLPKLDGSMWHAYRRKWAIERKHLPVKDVAAAGGWKDVNTLLEIYQQPDEESILAVTSETRKFVGARGRVTLFWGETAP
jgi:hypothetical protein